MYIREKWTSLVSTNYQQNKTSHIKQHNVLYAAHSLM
jgi:hypothetical protein